ncbi:MAG: TonB-dependent receptor [Ekhidna sp.]|nr:TonB-dependent receptor [Ekhidna sp.]
MRILSLAALMLLWNLSFGQDSLKTVRLEEVAITVERADDTAPVSQVTISRQEIRTFDLGQNPMVTFEKLSPSIISYSDAGSGFGNYNQIRLRGMDQSRISMTLNGVPLNDMVDQATFFSNFTDFASSMQSVQIQRGAGISSHGTASYAGSMSFESINLGRQDSYGGFGITGGSFSSLRINAEGGTGRTANNYSIYARVSRTVSEGYKRHSGSNAHSLFFSNAKFFDNSVLKFTALAGKTQNDQAYLPVLLSDIQTDPRTNYFDTDDTDDFEQEVLQLQYITFLNENLNWNTSAYYNGSRGFFPFTFGDQLIFSVINDQFGMFSNLSYQGEGISIAGGIHGYVMNRKNEDSVAPNLSQPTYEDETDKNEISTFAKVSYHFTDKLTGTVDLQVRSVVSTYTSDSLLLYAGDAEAERSDFFLNPKIGLSYQLNESSNVYASFGRTGREPARADLLVDPGSFSFINAANYTAFTDEGVFKSEYVNDFEFGYQFANEIFQVTINGFYMSFEDEIAAVGGLAGTSYFPVRQNVESSTRSGIELDLNYNAPDNLFFSLVSTYMQTNVDEFTDGSETFTNVNHAFAPDFQLMPSVEWLPLKSLKIGLDARYVSESYLELSNDPLLILPSYFVANGNIRWNISENIELGFWFNNIFNELYFTDGAPVDAEFDGVVEGPGYRIQPPRNFLASLKVRF